MLSFIEYWWVVQFKIPFEWDSILRKLNFDDISLINDYLEKWYLIICFHIIWWFIYLELRKNKKCIE